MRNARIALFVLFALIGGLSLVATTADAKPKGGVTTYLGGGSGR